MGRHEHFEHKADMGVLGRGRSLEESFEECAKAMYEIMIDLSKVEHKKEVLIEARAEERETLLIEWLNRLLSEGDIKDLFFSEFRIDVIKEEKNEFVLKGRAWGEKRDEVKHDAKTEVKAATYSGMDVAEKDGEWVAQCIVDV
jgi:SHS2 domain-containing protein